MLPTARRVITASSGATPHQTVANRQWRASTGGTRRALARAPRIGSEVTGVPCEKVPRLLPVSGLFREEMWVPCDKVPRLLPVSGLFREETWVPFAKVPGLFPPLAESSCPELARGWPLSTPGCGEPPREHVAAARCGQHASTVTAQSNCRLEFAELMNPVLPGDVINHERSG